jgi:hypothetical protein
MKMIYVVIALECESLPRTDCSCIFHRGNGSQSMLYRVVMSTMVNPSGLTQFELAVDDDKSIICQRDEATTDGLSLISQIWSS